MTICSANRSSICCLPQDIKIYISSFLNAQNLYALSQVDKCWNQCTHSEELFCQLDVGRLFEKKFTVYKMDIPVWTQCVNLATHGLFFAAIPTKSKVIEELRKCRHWQVESDVVNGSNPGITILDIPQGLSINKLKSFVPDLIAMDSEIKNTYGAYEVEKAYTVIIANNVLQKTSSQTAQEQSNNLQEYGAQFPRLIEVITLFVMNFLYSGKKLYLSNEATMQASLTHCEEKVPGNSNQHLSVGPFRSDTNQLIVSYYPHYMWLDYNTDSGVAAARRFESAG